MNETPCGKSHDPAPPQTNQSEPATALVGDCEDDMADLWLAGARVLELDLDRPELLDLRLEDCDVSGVVANDFIARRVQLRRTRLRGVAFAAGQLDDALVEDCITSELSLRFSRLRRVVFRHCDLSGADFYNASFDHVTFEGCNLRRARFHAATANCLMITNCDLAAITGTAGLKGAQLDASDLPSLAPALATEAGIVIRDA